MLRLWDGVTPVQQGGLGAFIRSRRLELGMSSQEDLAELAEVGQKTISNMENDRNFRSPIPPPEIVAAVARALQVSEASILHAAGYLTDADEATIIPAPSPAALPPTLVTRVVDQLISLDALLAEGLAEVAAMADAMEEEDAERGKVDRLEAGTRRRRAAG